MPGYPRPRNLPPTSLPEVAALLGVAPLSVASGDMASPCCDEVLLTGITHASSSAQPGDLYAGVPGGRLHGAQFYSEAVRAGAVAIMTDATGARLAAGAGVPILVVENPRARLGQLADRIYGAPTTDVTVMGITGTAGKTSTVYLIAAGLRAAGKVPGIIGTVETRMGDLVVDSTRTTPEATDLHALLAVARERGVDTVAMEVSSHALALGRVEGVRFRVGGFTNLGVDHLDFHADLDDYFAAKAQLFDGRCGIEIINIGDPAGKRLVKPESLTYTGPGGPEASWYASGITSHGYTQRFRVHGPGGVTVPSGVGLPGRHNVANAILAVASLVSVGVDPDIAGRAVAASAAAPGRMEKVTSDSDILGIVDYAHKPDAVGEVLLALRGLVAAGEGIAMTRKIICVIGAGGDRDKGKRPVMGAEAARGADLVIVTDDNPRTEDPASIRADVLRGAMSVSGATVVEVAGRREAIAEAVARAVPGDVIAVLGKGHERGQEIGGEVFSFDDRVELASALREGLLT